jgi:aminoglycoside phosphotransferase (APT) family kinase protein
MVEEITISKIEAEKIAREKLGSDIETLTAGRNNWVFANHDRVINIPKNEHKIDYGVRAAVTQILINAQIPTLDVIEYQSAKLHYIITKRKSGSSIRLADISDKDQESVHAQTADILRRIHEIKIEGYGRINSLGIGTNKSWSEFIDSFFSTSITRLYASKDLWIMFGSILENEFAKNRNIASDVKRGRLLHADYHIGNLLFNNLNLEAVMDLDIAASGDPWYDIAHYSRTFNINRKKGMATFYEFYGTIPQPEKERFYALVIWARKIASQGENRQDALKETIPEMQKIIKGIL